MKFELRSFSHAVKPEACELDKRIKEAIKANEDRRALRAAKRAANPEAYSSDSSRN